MKQWSAWGLKIWVGVVCSLTWQAGVRAASDGTDVQHNVSVTLSPVHLALPIVEVTGEYRANDQTGAAALVGIGSVKVSDGNEATVPVLELGAQIRYYVLGSFIHGMQVGAEMLYIRASAEDGSISAVATGVLIGPFVGYKIATNVGFTFEIQGGYQLGLWQADASDSDTGETASAGESANTVLLNINLGWSF